MPFNSETILNGFVYAVNFFIVTLFFAFVLVVVHKSQKTMKYRFVHGIMCLCIHYRVFNSYANYVISFKIFMLSNFKHELCMSHIILWQRRWPLQQQHHHRRRHQKNKFQLFSTNWNTSKKCVCVECVFFASRF